MQKLLLDLSPEEYEALKADIRANGTKYPIIVDENGDVIDGSTRKRIAEELGIPCPEEKVTGLSDDKKLEVSLGLNLLRRQVTREQKQELAAKLRRKGWPHERIATILGVSTDTVWPWTRDVSDFGNVDAEPGKQQVKTITDTRGRRQLARKPRKRDEGGLELHRRGEAKEERCREFDLTVHAVMALEAKVLREPDLVESWFRWAREHYPGREVAFAFYHALDTLAGRVKPYLEEEERVVWREPVERALERHGTSSGDVEKERGKRQGKVVIDVRGRRQPARKRGKRQVVAEEPGEGSEEEEERVVRGDVVRGAPGGSDGTDPTPTEPAPSDDFEVGEL